MIWKEAVADHAQADDPLAEWAYVVPGHPGGLERSRLRDAAAVTQHEVMSAWFLSNFSPMDDGGSWGGYNVGVRTPRYAPEVRTPDYFLEEEFGDVLPAATLTTMGAELKPRSAFWYPTPAIEVASSPPGDALVRALNRLAKAIERLPSQQPSIGHNSGSSAPVAEIADATKTALEAVSEGADGRQKGEQARSRLQLALDKMAEGAAGEAGKWIFRAAAERLLPLLWDAVSLLSHWLSSL